MRWTHTWKQWNWQRKGRTLSVLSIWVWGATIFDTLFFQTVWTWTLCWWTLMSPKLDPKGQKGQVRTIQDDMHCILPHWIPFGAFLEACTEYPCQDDHLSLILRAALLWNPWKLHVNHFHHRYQMVTIPRTVRLGGRFSFSLIFFFLVQQYKCKMLSIHLML